MNLSINLAPKVVRVPQKLISLLSFYGKSEESSQQVARIVELSVRHMLLAPESFTDSERKNLPTS